LSLILSLSKDEAPQTVPPPRSMPKRAPKPSSRPEDEAIVIKASCKSRNAYDLKVVSLPVGVGDRVEAGQIVATLEYYKIATEIAAPAAGTVARLHVKLDDEVQVGDRLIDLVPI